MDDLAMNAPRLDRWRLVQTAAHAVLIGRVTGRPRTPVGAVVVTSPVVQLAEDRGTAITRSGSIYRLGAPWPADEALPDTYRLALVEKLVASASGAPTAERLAAITAAATRCCQPGASVQDAILARLRPVSLSWTEEQLRPQRVPAKSSR
ncbi:hypothetical protein [Azospirillum canadense]|uniref:hypothetical protein n=1 Tax=Azospirillum canadense TaxID=403962 RepID=UPI00222615ED|nr:hypothetical protein [Azospirillum canadense]MCW2239256.1 hypothetical protein [Azospirillum canadense]